MYAVTLKDAFRASALSTARAQEQTCQHLTLLCMYAVTLKDALRSQPHALYHILLLCI